MSSKETFELLCAGMVHPDERLIVIPGADGL